MLTEIFVLILNTAAAVLGSALLLRAYLHGLRIGGRNQFAQFAAAMTDWMVRPLPGATGAAGTD